MKLKKLLLLAGLTCGVSLSTFGITANATWQGYGVWTSDIYAARREAKSNNRFFLTVLGGPGCSSCAAAEEAIFSKAAFLEWSITNRIALVYADAGNQGTSAFTEFRRLYPDFTSFPAVIVVDGVSGQYMLGAFYAVAYYELYKEQFLMNPEGFIRMVNVVLAKRDDKVQGSIGSNSYLLPRATALAAAPEVKRANLYNDYGQLALDKRSSTVSRYSNTNDWFAITNIVKQPGMGYRIQAVDVLDESDYGRVHFFNTLTDAKAQTNAFKSLTLNELALGFTYTPTHAGVNYILFTRTNSMISATVKYALSYQQVPINDTLYGFTTNSISIAETNGPLLVTVFRTNAPSVSVTVQVAATPSGVYSFNPIVTFPGGSLTQTLEIAVSNTVGIWQGDRKITLSLPPGGLIEGAYTNLTFTVLETDPVDDRFAPTNHLRGGAVKLGMDVVSQTQSALLLNATNTIDWFCFTNMVAGSRYKIPVAVATNVNATGLVASLYRADGSTQITNNPLPSTAGTTVVDFIAPTNGLVYLAIQRSDASTNLPPVCVKYSFEYYQWLKPVYNFAATNLQDRIEDGFKWLDLTVTRNVQTNEATTVGVEIQPGTAQSGLDYDGLDPAQLSFVKGATSETVRVKLVNTHTGRVGERYFNVALQPAAHLIIGTNHPARVTLAGDVKLSVTNEMEGSNGAFSITNQFASDLSVTNRHDFPLEGIMTGKTYRVSVPTCIIKGGAVPMLHFYAGPEAIPLTNVFNQANLPLQQIAMTDLTNTYMLVMFSQPATNGVWFTVTRSDTAIDGYVQYEVEVAEWKLPKISFAEEAVVVDDTNTLVQVTLIRTDNLDEPTTVSVWTSNAVPVKARNSEFTNTVNFAAGTITNVITISLEPDLHQAWTGPRSFTLHLAGTEIAYGYRQATVTIRDMEAKLDSRDMGAGDADADHATGVSLERTTDRTTSTLNTGGVSEYADDMEDWFVFTNLVAGTLAQFSITNLYVSDDSIQPQLSVYTNQAVASCLYTNLTLDLAQNALVYRAVDAAPVYVKISRDTTQPVGVQYTLIYRALVPCWIEFDNTQLFVSEAASIVRVPVRCMVDVGQELDLSVSVSVATLTNGTASANADYIPGDVLLAWPVGSTGGVQFAEFRLANYDSLWEGDENFFIALSSDSDAQIVPEKSLMEIVLIEKDAPAYGTVAVAGYGAVCMPYSSTVKIPVREGERMDVWVERSGGMGGAITSIWTWTDGTLKTVTTNELFVSKETGKKLVSLMVPSKAGFQMPRAMSLELAVRTGAGANNPTINKTQAKLNFTVSDAQFGEPLNAYGARLGNVPLRVGGTVASGWYVNVDGTFCSVPPVGTASVVMQATLTGPGTLSYNAKIENGDPSCTFTVKVGASNAVSVATGTNSIEVLRGTQTLTWTFKRGAQSSANAYAIITNMNWVTSLDYETFGTFMGPVTMVRETGPVSGLATLTVATSGRITGKFQFDDRVYTLVGQGYESKLLARSSVDSFWVTITPERELGRATGWVNIKDEDTDGVQCHAELYRNGWLDKPLSPVRVKAIETFPGYYTATFTNGVDFGSSSLAFTVATNGSVKVAGKLANGFAVSMSMQLGGELDDDEKLVGYAPLYRAFPLRKGYLFQDIEFIPTDDRGVLVAGRGTFVLQDKNFAVATNGYVGATSLSGGYYSRLDTLKRYYENGVELDVNVSTNKPFAPLYTYRGATNATAFATVEWPVTLEVNATQTGFDVTEAGANGSRLFTMSLNRVTGFFTGSVRAVYPYGTRETYRSNAYYGVLTPSLVEEQQGAGYFLMDFRSDTGRTVKQSYDIVIRNGQ